MNEMTPHECAERLKAIGKNVPNSYAFDMQTGKSTWKQKITTDDQTAIRQATTVMRKLAAGELVEVVHAHWEEVEPGHDILFKCSNCGRIISTSWGSCEDEDTKGCNGCDPTEEWLSCPTCDARMDGKDDNNAE